MIWLCCYVPPLDGRVHQALLEHARPGLQLHRVDHDPEYGYGKALAYRWRQGQDFAVVEHDIVIRADVAAAFHDCPEPYCAFPYAWTTTIGPALGCTRFRAELLQAHPDAMDEAIATPSAYGQPGHWRQLDVYLMRRVLWRKHGLKPHCHLPAVEHLNEEKRALPDAPTILDMAELDRLAL